MKKTGRQSGFTAIELLITLFIAAAFLVSGYQLYNLIIKDGGQTRAQSRASNVAYDYLQRYKSNPTYITNPCTVPAVQTPLSNSSSILNLSNVTVTVTITCPYSTTSSISKVLVTVQYNNPVQTVSEATYVTK
jgi:prepilin-type N-terminal cleavage/methylation domain-containing protein